MVHLLTARDIDAILSIQQACEDNGDLFIPTSREGYLRAFQYMNFCLGHRPTPTGELAAFLNCSIPTDKARSNLGRGHLDDNQLSLVGHMNTLLVCPKARHHGLGQIMVNFALDEFRTRGITHIFTTADSENAASIHLLETMQFRKIDTLEINNHLRSLYYRKLENA